MGQPLEKREEMREIRTAIKTVIDEHESGIGYRDLLPEVSLIVPNATYDQIKRELHKITGTELAADRSNPRRIIYFSLGTHIPPQTTKAAPMTQSRAQRALTLKVRIAILDVIRDLRLDSKTIIHRVIKAVPTTTPKQVEGILRSMNDYVLIDRTEPRHFMYSLTGAEHPQDLEIEDDGVIQRTVPATSGLCAPMHRTPIEWCVSVLAGV